MMGAFWLLFFMEGLWITLKGSTKLSVTITNYCSKYANKLNCWSKLYNCFNLKERLKMSFYQPREYPSTVLAKDSQNNAVATALVAAGSSNQRYYITGMDASYSTAGTAGFLQLLDGATVIWEGYFSGTLRHNFISPLMGSLASSFSAVLTASGTAGVIGKVNLRGYLI